MSRVQWVIYAGDGTYWLREGGTTLDISKAEHFATKKAALIDRDTWAMPGEYAEAVSVDAERECR